MPVAYLGREVSAVARMGYPSDGSKKLPRRLERLCCLLASGEYTHPQAAQSLRVSMRTVTRIANTPIPRSRIAFLRNEMAQSGFEAEPLVDKRNRVVMAAALARTLHQQGEAANWQETLAVTKAGTPIVGFDWRRTDQLRQLLDYLAKEVGDRASAGGGTAAQSVAVSLSVDDAVLRVQALFSRVDGAPVPQVAGGGTPAEGVAGGTPGGDSGTPTTRLEREYENNAHAGEPIEADYRGVDES